MPFPERPRVVVTGMGAVSGYGDGVAALWRGLLSGESAIREVTRFDPDRHRTRFASEVPAAAIPPAPFRGASLADRFALAALAEALADAGLAPGFAGRTAGVYFGCSTGGIFETERFYDELTGGERRARLDWLVSHQPSGPGDGVARASGATGPVTTISSACASGTLALGSALDDLATGEVDIAVAGGADALCELTFAGFNSLRAVDPAGCRPFRAGREGMTIGEGAAVLVLEREEDARQRGARARARLLGAGGSCDAHHMTAPDPSGEGIRRAVAATLAAAGVSPDRIDFVNAHGTGTPLNDQAEAAALALVFGERLARLPVTSTKGAVGHLLGSAGAIEAVATVLCLEARLVHPTPGGGEVDPAGPVDLVLGAPRPLPAGAVALSTNFAFGGSNGAVVLAAVEARG
ncbi:MAG TPA: beta-ketoacyl-[acyl-carrier-protein] synthase family protein [Thermoanaerobaculia bacterium]|nr:beta-ketoacyl-[acyl-carrier-protein] synthase family protein [Thermoanaerobaculia bacterium]